MTCFTLAPLELKPLSLILATLKAGGIPLLRVDFNDANDLSWICQFLNEIQAQMPLQSNFGLSINQNRVESLLTCFNKLKFKPNWLIISNWHSSSLPKILTLISSLEDTKILLEIKRLEELVTLQKENIIVNGLIAKGNEAGGIVGNDSAFILNQKLLKNTDFPIYVQGGMSKYTASACLAVGAKGVILNEELLLMPESYFPQNWQIYLQNLTGSETITIGENINQTIRVLKRPQFKVVDELEQIAHTAEIENKPQLWQEAIKNLVGWGEPNIKVWALGQSIGLAQQIKEKYHRTGRFIQAIINDDQENIKLSQQYKLLAPDSPLAQSHKTKYPIVQGPMTRVSDHSVFAQAVADGGGLPLLALALMNAQQVDQLLSQTKQLLGNKSWGIGILGFVPQNIRQEQLTVVKRIKPPFALIAGGRPDQAQELEQEGITTYLHVPNVPLLEMFVEQGARHFVLEGRECGGHIGPLSSFVLWSSAIAFILNLDPTIQKEIHVLFAGGIHDATSSAMVSVMASPLAKVGVKIGVLMGSAYLFTQEAVTSGAILPQFQQQAIECTLTYQLHTAPGHASRCADTPFVQEFLATRRQLLTENKSADEVKNTLESLTLGRLRIATKGIVRQGDELTQVDQKQQLTQGMYMLGEVATMRKETLTIKQLHQEISEESNQLIQNLSLDQDPSFSSLAHCPLDIAIIGISSLLPQAQDPETFWDNILHRVNCITEIPQERWDWRLYYSSDRHARDKVYSKWGGFLADLPFDPLQFGIPPKSLKSIEPMQLLALEAVRRVLIDGGIAYEKGDFPKEETCVIIGASGGMGNLGQQYATRSEIPRMVENPDQKVWERLPEWTEESFPGLLMNVISGRVANRFNLEGANFTVDAACASSLTAVDLAVQQLVTGKAKVAIAGGVDTIQSAFGYFCFSKTQALSPSGVVRSFDQNADGIVISEGVGMILLKPLVDAQRDGDRIYATIKGIGSSSDGKGLSLTAPATSGQQKAFLRAYAQAGFSPATLGLYEAHGTGTVAGDRAELTTIYNFLKQHQALPKSCVLGSVKTMIGHTKSTAGIAGLIKVALGLYYQVLPPHLNVDNPLPEIEAEESPLYLLQSPKPWIAHPDYPRRGAVSAFGFGGTNFHAVLEEEPNELDDKIFGTSNWNYELIVIASDNVIKLKEKIENLVIALRTGIKPSLKDLAYSYAVDAQPLLSHGYTASIVVHNLDELKEALTLILQKLSSTQILEDLSSFPPQIKLNLSGQKHKGKVAFLFPGQVAQYPNMGTGIALSFPEMRNAIATATKLLKDQLPQLLNQYLFPPSAYSSAQEQKAQTEISETHIAQSCLAAIELGYFEIMKRLNIKPDFVAGHSYGEYSALMAGGVISPVDFITLSEARGKIMSNACENSDGTMAVVKCTREKLEEIIKDLDDIIIANHNAPLQIVISGKKDIVKKVVEKLQHQNITARLLPVTGAFHSHLMASAQQILNEVIENIAMTSPQIKVYSNITAHTYPEEVEGIKQLLSQHLLSPVEFVNQIKNMYHDGAKIFVEIGPKHILSNLVNHILKPEYTDFITIPLDGNGRGLKGFLIGLMSLINCHFEFDLIKLFNHRNCEKLNLNQLTSLKKKLPNHIWLLNGGSIRPQTQSIGLTGKIAPLTVETINQSLLKPLNKNDHHDNQDLITPLTNNYDTLNNINHQNPLPKLSNNSNLPKFMNQPSKTFLSQDTRLAAYQSYQETMRQFLKLQEEVMRSFLTGQSSNPSENSTYNYQSFSAPTSGDLSSNIVAKTPSLPNHQSSTISAKIAQTSDLNPSPIITEAITSTINRSNLIELLLHLVSERTGYPSEMLGLDLDLEAELGIDSIKRVEIFGALQKVLPQEYAQNIKIKIETINQVKTLNKLVDLIIEIPSFQSEQKPQENNIVLATQTKIFDKNYLQETLLNLVSERTGYPQEMLGLDLDLEAELGIDSIKRVEILGALAKILPSSLSEIFKREMDSLTKVKNLNSLIDLLTKFTQNLTGGEIDGLGKSKNLDQSSSFNQTNQVEGLCDRYVMEAKSQPLSSINFQSLESKLTGLFLITQGDQIVTYRLQKQLEKLGVKTALITHEELTNTEKIEEKIKQIKQKEGEITGIIHLASLEIVPTPENLNQWRKLSQIQTKSLFEILKICREDLQKNQGKIIATSLMGGFYGRNNVLAPGSVLGGGNNGLLKTMMIEWETVKAKVIDFDHHSFTETPSILIQELINWDDHFEIGYLNKERFVFEIVNQPLNLTQNLQDSKSYIPQENWVILSMGGARGITAEIVKEMIKPNMTLILVGRSKFPLPENQETQGIIDINKLKNILIKKALGQGKQPLPIEIEQEIKQLQNNRIILENINYFQTKGVKVEYHSLDGRNESEFCTFINQIYDRFGKIDAVIQGAGIIQDKLIINKTLTSFDQVFSTKVDSTFILLKYLRPESLKLMVLFASIAGRTGNKGQCDYASANEVINRIAWKMRQTWINTRIISINWGPWDVTGMASAEVNRQFKERGVIPISTQSGRQFFHQELYYGSQNDVEIMAGIYRNLPVKKLEINNYYLPLLLTEEIEENNNIWATEKTISVEKEPYLLDHCLKNNPVVPAAVAMELMAEFAQKIWEDWEIIEVHNLQVLKGIILLQAESVTIKLVAQSHKQESKTLSKEKKYQCLMTTIKIENLSHRLLYQGEFVLRKKEFKQEMTKPLPSFELLPDLDITKAYKNYCFHGKKLQLIQKISHFGKQGSESFVKTSKPCDWLEYSFLKNKNKLDFNWLFDPGLVDSALQMALIWTHIYQDKGCLPTKFGKIKIIKAQDLSLYEELKLIFVITNCELTNLNFNAYYLDTQNQIVLALENIEMILWKS